MRHSLASGSAGLFSHLRPGRASTRAEKERSVMMNILTKAKESPFKWWFILFAIIIIMFIYFAYSKWSSKSVSSVVIPEAAVTDNATSAITDRISVIKKERIKLPEVREGAKKKSVENIRSMSDDAVAVRWNIILGKYREYKTKTGGLPPE